VTFLCDLTDWALCAQHERMFPDELLQQHTTEARAGGHDWRGRGARAARRCVLCTGALTLAMCFAALLLGARARRRRRCWCSCLSRCWLLLRRTTSWRPSGW
jgi:hypothetical protein